MSWYGRLLIASRLADRVFRVWRGRCVQQRVGRRKWSLVRQETRWPGNRGRLCHVRYRGGRVKGARQASGHHRLSIHRTLPVHDRGSPAGSTSQTLDTRKRQCSDRFASFQVLNRSMDPRTYETPAPLIQQLPQMAQLPLLPQQMITSGTRKDCIRLRGLPYEAQVEHILEFLGEHAKSIVYQGVHMVYNAQVRFSLSLLHPCKRYLGK